MSTTLTTSPHTTTPRQSLVIYPTSLTLAPQDPSRTLETQTTPFPPTPAKPFPILSLPPELLHQIALEFYALLPPLTVTPSNLLLPLHAQTPLTLSSPLFSILPPSLYYQNATFLFASPSVMKEFSGLYNRAEKVRKVKVWYGAVGPLGPGTANGGKGNGREDWVFSLLSNFGGLEEVGFVVESGLGMREGCDRGRHLEAVGRWWECVCDAVREGVGSSWTAGRRRGEGLVLRVECEGFEGWRARIDGGESKNS
ncbi:hypothetical protein BKA65DRAFT_475282 [Rhexocercosporidium sp. MPI-PUGE-AT-0058]|nr:hypothetical protein BKA65DRAFT_475282 [Rhexocercosporidium sp. MPI-PUGE-AT-0058]